MAFYLSKILWMLFNPFNILIIFIFLGVLSSFFKFRFLSKIFFVLSFILFFFTSILPTGDYLNYLLEKDFHYSTKIPQNLDGILILSGASNPYLTREFNQVNLGPSSERLFESLKIILEKPEIKIIFSGGAANIARPNYTDSDGAKKFFLDMGVDLSRITFEIESRNTFENILFSKKKAKPLKTEIWVVISSASHLRRVLNVADKVGWDLTPYATDFNYPKEFSHGLLPDLFDNLIQFRIACHEWLGLIYYYLSNKSDSI